MWCGRPSETASCVKIGMTNVARILINRPISRQYGRRYPYVFQNYVKLHFYNLSKRLFYLNLNNEFAPMWQGRLKKQLTAILKFRKVSSVLKIGFTNLGRYSGLNLNQDKATKPQTVQIVRQGEATPYWFKFNPLYIRKIFGDSSLWKLGFKTIPQWAAAYI